jgi:hypothetical protein
MKRILTVTLLLLLVLCLLPGCRLIFPPYEGNGGSEGEDESDDSTTAAGRDVILASQLISAEDATVLIGQSMAVNSDSPNPYTPFTDKAYYTSEGYSFDIWLTQEALHDKDSDLENDLVKGDWQSYMKALEKAYSNNKHEEVIIIETDAVQGASAYLQDGKAMGLWMLHIFCGDYKITLNLCNASLTHEDSAEEIAWKQVTLEEMGNFAVKQLNEILG